MKYGLAIKENLAHNLTAAKEKGDNAKHLFSLLGLTLSGSINMY